MQKLINITDDHYVVVDDSKIEVDDWYVDDAKQIRKSVVSDEAHWQHRQYNREYMKITHSTRPFGGSATAISLYEVKELIGEVDLEILAANLANPNVCKTTNWIEGYNQALEDNKEKKYTEEDLGLFLEYVRDNYTGMGAPHLVHNKGGQRKTKVIVQDYIQSLQPKTEWEVEMVDGKLKLK